MAEEIINPFRNIAPPNVISDRIYDGLSEEEKGIIKKLLNLPSPFSEYSGDGFDQSKATSIIPKEYAITDALSQKPIIGTFGLGNCIAIVIWNPEEKSAAVAHFDAATSIDSINYLFQEFGLHNISKLQISFVGGDPSSVQMAIEMTKRIEFLGGKVSSADIIRNSRPSRFVIDSSSGKIFPDIQNIDNGDDLETRVTAAAIGSNVPLKKKFDGRNII